MVCRHGSQCYLVVNDDAFDDGFVQHLLVPVLQSLGLGYLHISWVTVEYVVITLARRTRPDVCHRVPVNHTYIVQ